MTKEFKYIKPYRYEPFKHAVCRCQQEDGSFKYHVASVAGDPMPRTLGVYEESFMEFLGYRINNLHKLVDLLEDQPGEMDLYGYLFKTLLKETQGVISEAFHHIHQNFGGDFILTLVDKDDRHGSYDQIVDIRFEKDKA